MSLRAACRARGWLLLLAALLGLVALAMPPVLGKAVVFEHVIVFDITQSMNVLDRSLDGKPASRLQFARRAVISALGTLPCGSRAGVAVFTERRTLFLLAPVEICGNRAELVQAIERIDGSMAWERGSYVTRGVFSAIASAVDWQRPASLLFITDGHEAPPLGDRRGFSLNRPALMVKGALIGVGGSTPQPIPFTDREGRLAGWWTADMVTQRPAAPGQRPSMEHLSFLHEAHLVELAHETGLKYVALDTMARMDEVMKDASFGREQPVPLDVRWVAAMLGGAALLFYLFGAPRMDARSRS